MSGTRETPTVDPDAVFDCVAYKPAEVASAVDVFADVDAYVYISSGAAYGSEVIPKREGETPLCDCTDEQAATTARRPTGHGRPKATAKCSLPRRTAYRR